MWKLQDNPLNVSELLALSFSLHLRRERSDGILSVVSFPTQSVKYLFHWTQTSVSESHLRCVSLVSTANGTWLLVQSLPPSFLIRKSDCNHSAGDKLPSAYWGVAVESHTLLNITHDRLKCCEHLLNGLAKTQFFLPSKDWKWHISSFQRNSFIPREKLIWIFEKYHSIDSFFPIFALKSRSFSEFLRHFSFRGGNEF